jgi:hypothetical protein
MGWELGLALVAVVGFTAWALFRLYAIIRTKSEASWAPKIEAEAEFYIPFSYRKMKRAMLKLLPEKRERKQFSSIMEKLELVLTMRKYPESRRLLADYTMLNPHSDPHDFEDVSEEKFNTMEDRFLLASREMLLKANFTPVTCEELEWALREDYLSTLPVEINWDGLDPGPFRRYKEMQENEDNIERFAPQSDKAENAFIPSNRVWVFRRGIGLDKTEDYFMFEKIDHLLIIFFTWLSNRFPSLLRIFPFLGKVKSVQEVETKRQAKKHSRRESAGLSADSVGLRTLDKGTQPEDEDSNVITRRTLFADVRKHGLGSLFRKSTIVEPTYKEMVVMYKRDPKKSVAALDPTHASAINDRGIFLRTYRNIPMSDLELIFPEKKLGVRPMDFVYLAATGAIGIATLIIHFSDEISSWFGLAALLSFVTLAVRTFITYRYSIIYYQRFMLGFLNDKAMSSDRDVLLYLIDKLKLQELKESAVLYFFLWTYGKQTPSLAHKVCEEFMMDIQRLEKHPTHVRFAVHDALARLLSLGMAKRADGRESKNIDDEAEYMATPLGEMPTVLGEHWAHIFATTHLPSDTAIPYTSASAPSSY